MAVDQTDGFNLDDRDRLPWLEPAGAEDEEEGVSPVRVIGLVIAGLLLLGLIVGGGYWLKHRGGAGDDGAAQIIPAQNGSYKIPANASDAREFEGEGDESFAASAGEAAGGRIDQSRAPEAPRADLRAGSAGAGPGAGAGAAATPPPAAHPSVSATVRETQAAAPAPAAASTNGRIQVGAYNSAAIAETVWTRLARQFDYLKEQAHTVEPVQTGGRTLHRLRVTMGSPADATATCDKLRTAGENCMVVR